MADDIVKRLRVIYCAADDLTPCGTCLPCQAADEIERLRAREQDLRMHAEQDACEIERLRAAIDALLTDIDGDHRPEWSSDDAEAAGKKPWCCAWCGAADGGWPCVHRRALDELKAARRG